ncbi:hypothetical protein FDJ44_gp27 [Microbacterium phage Pikmin]|uniref:Uncharacterized protein n=3 Tax=Pikminvirus pikmin TaxID=2560596 RepID=A0A2P1CKF2_9CAUD|nr:hypothetical protein FDJ44_gp27 [Microbacterium phage Pikmin]AVJ51018.1 hypothetical protein PBI_PAJAZA_27 [Microbacterium phage Pajaza]AVJ51165.1 hypothetical protein PBI_PIKMIN_27 [Microbacterium phage Pikmin]AVJ51723.1 hypothetical protein PBI_CASEY_27 [Microbacterium phage Casey]
MSNTRVAIPGNVVTTFGRIYEDTTKEALEQHLRFVISGQAANKRTNPIYKREVQRLKRAIAAR